MHTSLFVEVLDTYLLHFTHRCPAVTTKYVSSLIQLIEQQFAEQSEQGAQEIQSLRAHFEATKRFIASKQANDPRFEDIQ